MVGIVTTNGIEAGGAVCVTCGANAVDSCDACGVGICEDCLLDEGSDIFCSEDCLDSYG